MRTLVVADEYPWPLASGSRLRLDAVLAGLARCGPVDLVSVVPERRGDLEAPSDAVRRTTLVRVPGARAATVLPARCLFPRDVRGWWGPGVARDVRAAVVEGLGGHGQCLGTPWDAYDLLWWSGVHAWVAAGMPAAGRPPAVLDVDDLDDEKILGRLPVRPATGARSGALPPLAVARRAAAWASARAEVVRWRHLYRLTGRARLVAVVCSELDAARAAVKGFARVEVVPNGYPVPAVPAGRTVVGDHPTVLFAGTLRYPPNADGARWLVERVAPLLGARVPGLRVRLVGRHEPSQRSLDDPPQVTLVGPVDDMAAELARADVVAVPLRYGSGTRLKVLEAFAHRVPVVSTTLGAEGLDVTDGVHLLLADDPDAFASAVARVVGDDGLRRRVVDAAEAHYRARFRSELVGERVAALARQVAGTEVGAAGAR